MSIEPLPANDFARYIRTYYEACRRRMPEIEAIAGKWTFRDLIPGMSDFDTRFIVRDGMTADDWCRMSSAIGLTHLELCRLYPRWARNLEHLPGINLTWSELTAEATYYPEYRQWTFYHTSCPQRLEDSLQTLGLRPWDAKDEYFHLKKFCLYYGRYDRAIDPAINLGPHQDKYPLHSRLMHYFNPPVLSAMCILQRRNIAGKHEAFEIAETYLPDLPCWDSVRTILEAGYNTPAWYEEPLLCRLEDQLEEALRHLARLLRPAITLVPDDAGTDIALWKRALKSVPMDPALVVFDNMKFSRLMKGRLEFYAAAPRHFDVTWLIANELGRIRENFFRVPFSTYWRIVTGHHVSDPIEILEALRGNPLSDSEWEAVREFARLTGSPWSPGNEREHALAIASVFDNFYRALSAIATTLYAGARKAAVPQKGEA